MQIASAKVKVANEPKADQQQQKRRISFAGGKTMNKLSAWDPRPNIYFFNLLFFFCIIIVIIAFQSIEQK